MDIAWLTNDHSGAILGAILQVAVHTALDLRGTPLSFTETLLNIIASLDRKMQLKVLQVTAIILLVMSMINNLPHLMIIFQCTCIINNTSTLGQLCHQVPNQ